MITGPDDVWQLLPHGFREFINSKELFPWEAAGWHQVFGRGRDIQGGVYSYAGEVMLLQFTHDDLIYLNQGDVGAMTFWLSHQDVLDRRWDRTELLFECH